MSYAGDITPQQAWEILRDNDKAILVDVRTDREWRTVGIPDVSSLGRPAHFIEWVDNSGQPHPDFAGALRAAGVGTGPVVFLCRSGNRSVGAAETATAAGIEPSYNVLEGFEGAPGPDGQRTVNGWKVLGLPWKQR